MTLRRIFGPKRDKVTGGWRKLHEELHNLYAFPSMIRMIKSRRIGKRRNARRILVAEPGGRRPLGRPRRKWAILK
jgi:hypothetical protein